MFEQEIGQLRIDRRVAEEEHNASHDPYPPAAAGTVNANQFCGMTMVQHDTQGESFVIPKHLALMSADLSERYTYMTKNYLVSIYDASDDFLGFPMCYRIVTDHYRLTPWENFAWDDIKNRIHNFAQEVNDLGSS
ncbi:Hypothetical protein PHPALM_16039 [Phytophthora palmivora]|uniref:Uncharacterized protein n=1 Tax=Phytophthora palmivora TaxID=4796 RepID=A0A2P4XQR5_9STRA|nr:Hypothetical protein PHPALM_16039 [Phytophthora palmivora]